MYPLLRRENLVFQGMAHSPKGMVDGEDNDGECTVFRGKGKVLPTPYDDGGGLREEWYSVNHRKPIQHFGYDLSGEQLPKSYYP